MNKTKTPYEESRYAESRRTAIFMGLEEVLDTIRSDLKDRPPFSPKAKILYRIACDLKGMLEELEEKFQEKTMKKTSSDYVISLYEFRTEILSSAVQFSDWYAGMAEDLPDNFPLRQTTEEWLTAFLFYQNEKANS